MDPSQPTITHQPPTQGPDPESGNQEKPPQETPATSGHPENRKVVLTQYLSMLIKQPHIIYNILAWFFLWISLAGFLVLPSSFPQIEKFLNESGELTKVVQSTQNVPLLVFGIICCLIGGTGLLWLGLRHSENHIWLLSRIFVPGMFNGISGLISTFVSLHNSKNGVHYGATTIATLVVTGGCTVIFGSLTVYYTVLKIRYIKHHNLQMREDKCGGGEMGETQTEMVK